MTGHHAFALTKAERIHSRTAVERLFSSHCSSVAAYPIRTLWYVTDCNGSPAAPVSSVTDCNGLPAAPVSSVTDCNGSPATPVISVTGCNGSPATPSVAILVSVPKKRLRHAVDRNRMKRQVREAYRLNKHILSEAMQGTSRHLDIAFICISDRLHSSNTVHNSVRKTLMRIVDSL